MSSFFLIVRHSVEYAANTERYNKLHAILIDSNLKYNTEYVHSVLASMYEQKDHSRMKHYFYKKWSIFYKLKQTQNK